MTARRRRCSRGSGTLQLVIIGPVLLLFTLMTVAAGRLAIAQQTIEAAAFDAARAASIARTPQEASSAARSTALRALSTPQLECVGKQVGVDTAGFRLPVGTPASVQATLRCDVDLAEIALPGLPGRWTLTATASSPLDTYRERTGQ